MRILHIMAGKGNGGAELYSTDLMLSLHQAGIDQCVVLRDSAPRAAELAQAGIRMAGDVLSLPPRLLQRRRLARVIARERPDIIQCWMRRAAELAPARLPEGVQMIGWFGDYEELPYFSHCTQFIGVTPDLVRHLVENGVPPETAHYIPTFPSVDEAPPIDRAELTTPANAKVLLTLSRLHPSKGLDTLIQALQRLPGCYLWVAGDGVLRGKLEELARKLGLRDRVRFLGWRTDRGALLRAADACILPSRYEPFGTVILDAWSTLTPLIACASEGPRAYIEPGVNGMLVPIDDPAALADAVRSVLEDTTLRQGIVAGGYTTYLSEFTRQKVTERYITFYRSLLPA